MVLRWRLASLSLEPWQRIVRRNPGIVVALPRSVGRGLRRFLQRDGRGLRRSYNMMAAFAAPP
jgi:hypothetical protein